MSSRMYSKRLMHRKHKPHVQRGRNPRPKTFSSEASARKWAESNKITKYSLVNSKEGQKEKKIRIVQA